MGVPCCPERPCTPLAGIGGWEEAGGGRGTERKSVEQGIPDDVFSEQSEMWEAMAAAGLPVAALDKSKFLEQLKLKLHTAKRQKVETSG